MASIQVALEDGSLVMCKVIERLGYNHDLGANAAWVEHDGKEFCAERKLGAWRKRGARDRITPLLEELKRNPNWPKRQTEQ
jgi:hypothetical protein